MTKRRKRTKIVEALRAGQSTSLRNVGGYEIWECPCGKHTAAVPNHREITAGVVRSISKQMACLPKGCLT